MAAFEFLQWMKNGENTFLRVLTVNKTGTCHNDDDDDGENDDYDGDDDNDDDDGENDDHDGDDDNDDDNINKNQRKERNLLERCLEQIQNLTSYKRINI